MIDTETLLYEALQVGMINIIFNYIGKRIFPHSFVGQAIASGFIYHITAEYVGLNEYYVKTHIPLQVQENIIGNSRLKRCQESICTTEDSSVLASVLEYSSTTTS